MSDANLIYGSTGTLWCVFWDRLSDFYSVYPINQQTAEDFRNSKATFLPLMEQAGGDLCQIGFFSPFTRDMVKATNYADWHDVGKECEPVVSAHGPIAESRIEDVKATLAAARAKGVELFNWPTTMPIRVFIYDNELTYKEGVRADGRSGRPPRNNTVGITLLNSDYMTVINIDISELLHPELLTLVAAHNYFYALISAVVGCTCNLPEFANAGGGDYFASHVLGPESLAVGILFQLAVNEAHAGKSSPLSKHIKAGTGSGAAYLRGFVAFRYMSEKWGESAWIQLYYDNVNGSPNNYLFNMSRMTTLTIDEFDRDLNDWLRQFPSTVPTRTPAPARTPRL